MKSKEEIKDKINSLKKDIRLSYPTATIRENAPLALIQLELETKIKVLEWVIL